MNRYYFKRLLRLPTIISQVNVCNKIEVSNNRNKKPPTVLYKSKFNKHVEKIHSKNKKILLLEEKESWKRWKP